MSSDDYRKQIEERARDMSPEQAIRAAEAVSAVQSAARHACAHLRSPADDKNMGAFLVECGVWLLRRAGFPGQEILDIVRGQLDSERAQAQAGERLAHELATKDQIPS